MIEGGEQEMRKAVGRKFSLFAVFDARDDIDVDVVDDARCSRCFFTVSQTNAMQDSTVSTPHDIVQI